MTTLRITSNEISKSLLVRTDLKSADAMIFVDYLSGNGWEQSEYHNSVAERRIEGLASVGSLLLEERWDAASLETTWDEVTR